MRKPIEGFKIVISYEFYTYSRLRNANFDFIHNQKYNDMQNEP